MVRNCGSSTYFMTPTNSKHLNNIDQYEERQMSRNRKSILKNERVTTTLPQWENESIIGVKTPSKNKEQQQGPHQIHRRPQWFRVQGEACSVPHLAPGRRDLNSNCESPVNVSNEVKGSEREYSSSNRPCTNCAHI